MYCDGSDSSTNYMNNQSKWQITLISKHCTIRKRIESWQICPKSINNEESDSRLILTIPKFEVNSQYVLERTETTDAEICCNREDLEELLGAEKRETDQENGNIILKEYLKLITSEEVRINFLLKILTKAINEHKSYAICGVFPALRKPLSDRGWIEKKAIRKMLLITPNTYEGGLRQIEKLLRIPADFIWYTNKKLRFIRTDDKIIVNKFAGSYFTSKIDMCNNLENVYWFYETGVSNVQFPRCYNIYQSAQVEEFIHDYLITACLGILKWFLLLANLVGPKNTCFMDGTIPLNVISFALERCVEHMSIQIHEDIDRDDCEEDVSLSAWHQFLDWFHKIINGHAFLKKNVEVDMNELVTFVRDIVRAMMKYRAQSNIDGIHNIWILKPGDNSLGRGIVLRNSLVDILTKVNQAARESTQYVIQKYIEQPLLIHKTKIDIRQWFLITSTQPLIVWMYKDILVRFASKDFTFSDFHESIHLCNTTVQLKYRKLQRSNSNLPEELHWNLQHFKDYLRQCDQKLTWEKVIRPGIKQNLIGALLASQDNMVNRKNSFQLYGADFVVADDFSVWLLEINTNPRLHPPSSEVTAKLYPEVIEDAMKVVLDRRKNKKAPHGRFECIYKQHNPFYSVNILGQGTNLSIRGKAFFATPKLS